MTDALGSPRADAMEENWQGTDDFSSMVLVQVNRCALRCSRLTGRADLVMWVYLSLRALILLGLHFVHWNVFPRMTLNP